MLRSLLIILGVLSLLAALAGALLLWWGYNYISRDLPRLNTVADYEPPAVSTLYAADGTQLAEVFADERRYPVKLADVPVFVRNAFLAAEDASFYSHPGIDPTSILRALVKNLRTGEVRQGGSTITQQVVKNLLLTREKKLERKLKEAILAWRIEKRLSKDDILEIYLNQIFFGSSAYGLRAAARVYFHKEVGGLTLGEAAMLAGLPAAPSRYSPLRNFDAAKRRQEYVLRQMVKAGFVTPAAARSAAREKVKVHPAPHQLIGAAHYYAGEVIRRLREDWKELDIDRAGVSVYTYADVRAYGAAERALRRGLREVDKRRGWRGPIDQLPDVSRSAFAEKYRSSRSELLQADEVYPAMVLTAGNGRATVALGKHTGQLDLKDSAWARKLLDTQGGASWGQPARYLRPGAVIEVSLRDPEARSADDSGSEVAVALDQTPELEGALILVNPHSGAVLTVIGGYSYERSQYNRATQAYRQPGSAFKPIVYLTAIDRFNYTPSTIVYDEPRTFKVGDQEWTPANFDESFLGPITLQTALEKSRNLVSADIVARIGVEEVIQYARRLGIESALGRNLSLSLGSSEVTLLELTRAYGVFAAQGVLFESLWIARIVDRHGRILYDAEQDRIQRARRAVSEASAFIMAHMMKGTVERGTGYRVKPIGRPVAGKTGTSNDQMDAWFIGYTPEWVCGVWVGFNEKKSIGSKETGGVVAAPIWLAFMSDFLSYQDQENYEKLVAEMQAEARELGITFVPPAQLEPLDFSVPEGVDPFWINRDSGARSESGQPGAILEYFKRGTEPGTAPLGQDPGQYWNNPEL